MAARRGPARCGCTEQRYLTATQSATITTVAATDEFKKAVADYVGSLGYTISLHSADPGTNGANELGGGGYAQKNTAWSLAAIQGDGSAKITGTTQRFDVAANAQVLWFGVRNGSTFLYGRQLTPGVTVNNVAPGKVDVTPTYSYAQS